MDDTWSSRDLPVLEAAVRLTDADPFAGPRLGELADATTIDLDTVQRAVRALESDHLVRVDWMAPVSHSRIAEVSGNARRAVGAWPSPDTGADRLLAALEAQIAATSDPEQKTRLTAIRDGLVGAGREVVVAVVTKMLTGS